MSVNLEKSIGLSISFQKYISVNVEDVYLVYQLVLRQILAIIVETSIGLSISFKINKRYSLDVYWFIK